MSASATHYDRWAREYDRRWRRYTDVTLGALLDTVDLRGRRDVVDVGCGTGVLIARLLDREPALHITGLDRSAGMLAVARERLAGRDVTLVQAAAERLPLPAASVDLVTLASVLHYLDDPAVALSEARRVLRPHGQLALVDYVPRGPVPRLADRLIRLYDRGHRRTRDAPELCRLLRSYGFEVVRCRRFGIGPLVRGVVAIAALRMEPVYT